MLIALVAFLWQQLRSQPTTDTSLVDDVEMTSLSKNDASTVNSTYSVLLCLGRLGLIMLYFLLCDRYGSFSSLTSPTLQSSVKLSPFYIAILVPSITSYSVHTVFIQCSYSVHTVFILCPYSVHTVFIHVVAFKGVNTFLLFTVCSGQTSL